MEGSWDDYTSGNQFSQCGCDISNISNLGVNNNWKLEPFSTLQSKNAVGEACVKPPTSGHDPNRFLGTKREIMDA